MMLGYYGLVAPMRPAIRRVRGFRKKVALWTPAALFALGEEGTWYDPSDLSTMFQDAAGTVPVTAVGQPVGRINDKSGRGNHATQTTTVSRPVLAREPASQRRNLVIRSEEFGNAVWVKAGATITENAGTAPDGTNTAAMFVEAGTSSKKLDHYIPMVTGTTYTVSAYFKDINRRFAALGVSYFNNFSATFDLLNETTARSSSSTTSSMEAVGDGWYRCSLTFTAGSAVTSRVLVGSNIQNNGWMQSYETTANDSLLIWGAQFEKGSTATPYQRAVSAYDVTEVGQSNIFSLVFDGVDDGMAAASIDFTATDKMTVLVGRVNNTASGLQSAVELSANSDILSGSCGMLDGGSGFLNILRGTARSRVTNASAITAGVSFVESVFFDLSASSALSSIDTRLNAVPLSGTSEDGAPGGGNFGNYPLFIGRRAGTTQPLNGRIYSLIVRGAASTTDQITAAETWVNNKTGAY